MNSISGLEIANSLPRECCFIFTTAHAQYALDGFNLDAVDFLHKPFAYDRFEVAVEKAIRRLDIRPAAVPDCLVVKQEYSNVSIALEDILYIEALGNYTKIFRESGGYVLSHTNLKTIQAMLPVNSFLRIHRSYVISVKKVERFTKNYIQLEKTSILLPIGECYASQVNQVLTNTKGFL